MILGRIFWWIMDRLYDFGRASIAGIIDAQPADWPECQIDGCHEEATCKVGPEGRRLMACFQHGREYLGVATPRLDPAEGCDLGAA